MKQADNKQRFALRAVVLAAALCAVGAAQAAECETGNPDLVVRFDNTIKYNYGHRISSQNGAILKSVTSDDGDHNFDKGVVSNRLDPLSEFDVVCKKSLDFRGVPAATAALTNAGGPSARAASIQYD